MANAWLKKNLPCEDTNRMRRNRKTTEKTARSQAIEAQPGNAFIWIDSIHFPNMSPFNGI